MRRRRVLQALAGSGMLAGCLTSSETTPSPVTVTDTEAPRFDGTVTISEDAGFWSLELPRFDPGKAVYQYKVENLTPDVGAFDVLFFDFGNYNEYTSGGGPTWYGPLTSMNVTDQVEQSTQFQSYGDIFGPLYLVLDGTGYGATPQIQESESLELRLTVDVFPNGVGHLPEVGEVRMEREPEPSKSEPEPSKAARATVAGDGRDWHMVVEIADDLRDGELKIYHCRNREERSCMDATDASPTYRRSLHNTNGIERFPFRSNGQLGFPNANYAFAIEQDDKIAAWTTYTIDRSVTVRDPQFESFGKPDKDERPKVYETGNTGFSFRVDNTGNAPIWLSAVAITEGIDTWVSSSPSAGFWLYDSQEDAPERVRFRLQMDPGDGLRVGALGYNVPEIDEVEAVCSGEPTDATLEISARSGYAVECQFQYTLDEPAARVGDADRQLYACLEGSISEFKRIGESY